MDYSPPGSSVHGISQARILERVAIFFFRGYSQSRYWTNNFCIPGGFFTTEPLGKPINYNNIIILSSFWLQNGVTFHWKNLERIVWVPIDLLARYCFSQSISTDFSENSPTFSQNLRNQFFLFSIQVSLPSLYPSIFEAEIRRRSLYQVSDYCCYLVVFGSQGWGSITFPF